jgi:demethylspheroidene O-methyltransferase
MTLARRLLGARDRILQDPGFRRAAEGNPLLRVFSRRYAARLFSLCAGFVHSQTLVASIDLGLFDMLASGPKSVAWLARASGTPVSGLRVLLEAALALRIFDTRGPDIIGLTALGAAVVGNDGLLGMVRHHRHFYADLADPVRLLDRSGGTNLAGYWAYATAADPARLPPSEVEGYSALMASSQDYVAESLLRSYPFARHRRLLDVGGGSGTFAATALDRCPGLTATVADLPPVAALAAARFEAAKLSGRAQVAGLDLFADPLPAGADLATLIRVLHDHDDAAAFKLLVSVHQALAPGGTLLIAEPMAGRGIDASGEAYFALYLLAMRSGRVRSSHEIERLLRLAGFGAIRSPGGAPPFLIQIVVARKSDTGPVNPT